MRILNSDSLYKIGSDHKVCEDYALNGSKFFGDPKVDNPLDENFSVHYAVICDGCSSSGITNGRRDSLNVDLGARILAACAIRSIDPPSQSGSQSIALEEKKFRDCLKEKLITVKSAMGLPLNIFDSTLIVATNFNHGRHVFAYGDGTIAFVAKDGTINIYNISYKGNAPYYISYEMGKLENKYIEMYGKNSKIIKHILKKGDTVFKNYEMEVDATEPFYVADSNGDDVFIFSDGIESFTKNGKDFVPFLEILAKSLDVKGRRGEYLHRVTNLLNRHCEKEGLYHTDDYSTAGIITVEEIE